jgi:hypothetical protein
VRRLLLALLPACAAYDPLADVPHGHREVRDASTAIGLILAENPPPLVYAIGEYHVTAPGIARSSLDRFTNEIMDVLEPRAKHLVIETWAGERCASLVERDLAATTRRPSSTQMEILQLRHRASTRLDTHLLPWTCLEREAMLDAHRKVNYLLLLELITVKLRETIDACRASSPGPIIVYGGALHNDLYPRWPLEELSYARPLADELGGGVLEVDLVVPEVVAPLAIVRDEPWFPLLARVSPDRTLVWERGPGSYVVILPAHEQTAEQVAKVARAPEVM